VVSFTYKAHSRQGEILQDEVDGTSSMAVSAALRQQGLLVIDIRGQRVFQKGLFEAFKKVT
jgi:type IV pilus assembly protein PilC